MIGLLLMLVVLALTGYLVFFKFYPGLAFRYTGRGERKGRAEYQRIKREHPNAPEASVSEAEFVEKFVQSGTSPWLYMVMIVLLMAIGIPTSCVVGVLGMQ